MRDIDQIAADGSGTLSQWLKEAFEAGRTQGKREAASDIRAKLDGMLDASAAETSAHPSHIKVESVLPSSAASDGSEVRVAPGTVKPTIERLIMESEHGLTTNDVVRLTQFKPNSVRGTLWALGAEGFAVKREGRWFPAHKENEAPSDAEGAS